MSGGVDSAVAAFALKQQGYDVVGIYLSAWCNDRSLIDQEMANQVAEFLKIKFKVLDIKKDYESYVIDYFYQQYRKGRVPSPDVICNRDIKFGLFLDWAMKAGFDKIATGHYAKLQPGPNRRLAVYRPKDKAKDQTYFLFQLSQSNLNKIIWPLSALTKKQVRLIANEHNFPNKDKPESMGICFIGEINLVDFLKQRIRPKQGPVVSTAGRVVGEHKGVWFYSLGQRHGFNITKPGLLPPKAFGPKGLKPLYVIGKETKKNKLVVSDKSDCFIQQLELSDVTTIWPDEPLEDKTLFVRLTNLGPLLEGKIKKTKNFHLVALTKPTLITSPGQPAVFYDKTDRLIGGGIIEAVS